MEAAVAVGASGWACFASRSSGDPWAFFFFEIAGGPLHAIDAGEIDGILVDNDIGGFFGLEFRVTQVGACGLKTVEHEGGGFMVDASGAEQLDDLHERNLDRVGIFEQGEAKFAALGLILGNQLALVLNALMKIAMAFAAQRRRAALHAVDF